MKNFTELLDRLDNNSKQLMELQTKETEQLAEIDDDLTGLEKERNLIEQSIGAASKVLDKAAGEVATQTAKAEFTEELNSDRVGHGRLRELCEGGGIPGYVGMVNQLVTYPAQYARACSAVMDTVEQRVRRRRRQVDDGPDQGGEEAQHQVVRDHPPLRGGARSAPSRSASPPA